MTKKKLIALLTAFVMVFCTAGLSTSAVFAEGDGTNDTTITDDEDLTNDSGDEDYTDGENLTDDEDLTDDGDDEEDWDDEDDYDFDCYDMVSYGDKAVCFYADSSSFKFVVTVNGKTYSTMKKEDTEDGYWDYYVSVPALKLTDEVSYVATSPEGDEYESETITVGRGPLDISSIELNYTAYTYSGKGITPGKTVYYYPECMPDQDIEKKLKSGTDFTTKYTNNVNVGTAKVTVTGKGNYSGSNYAYFKIIPKGTSISKLTKAKKAFTVKWKKQAAKMSKTRITGYQVRYSLKSSMASAKTVTVKGYASTSKKIRSLKKKKTYYVQVRTYKVVSGKYYYSKWSAKKSVKTK